MPRLPPEELPYHIWKLRTRHIFIAINETASKNILRKISNENGQRLQRTADSRYFYSSTLVLGTSSTVPRY